MLTTWLYDGRIDDPYGPSCLEGDVVGPRGAHSCASRVAAAQEASAAFVVRGVSHERA